MNAIRRAPTGIEVRHSRRCGSRSGATCSCRPSYQGSIWIVREQKRLRRTFGSLAEAKRWRAESLVALGKGTLKAPTRITLGQAAEVWLEGTRSGLIRNRSGDPYKASALRGYETALRLRLVPALGRARMTEISQNDLQDLIDGMASRGFDPATVRNTLLPIRAIFRRALARGELAIDPTTALELPAVRGRRERVADPHEATRLIDVLDGADRPLWATAIYAGLRRGELQALHWECVDFKAGLIQVKRAWDREAGFIEPKSRAGRRSVPLAAVLRSQLVEHRLRTGPGGLVFGNSSGRPFDPSSLGRRSRTRWAQAGLKPLVLHEARHTFASLMIAAGVNAKALSTYLGHSSITVTLDRYGHLMPGSETAAAFLLDVYLATVD